MRDVVIIQCVNFEGIQITKTTLHAFYNKQVTEEFTDQHPNKTHVPRHAENAGRAGRQMIDAG